MIEIGLIYHLSRTSFEQQVPAFITQMILQPAKTVQQVKAIGQVKRHHALLNSRSSGAIITLSSQLRIFLK